MSHDPDGTARVDAARIDEVRRRIDGAFTQFDSALFSAGPRIADRAPLVSPWSPLDVAEHVTLANRYLLMLAEKCARKSVAKHARGEVPADPPYGIDRLDHIASREFRWESPTHMLPTGRVTLDEVRGTLSEQQARARSLADSVSPEAVRLHTVRMAFISPDARLDLHEILAFVALHAERHAAQTRRITMGSGLANGA